MSFRVGVVVLLLAVLASAAHENVRSGYQEFPGIGYYFVGNPVDSWAKARVRCQASGGELAIVNSQDEADVLQYLLTRVADSGDAYIGYHDLFAEGDYLTLFGVPLNNTGYNVWATGRPNGGANENCGSFSTKGGLFNVQCSSKLRYVCEQEVWRSYELVENVGYYKLILEATTWGNARRRCAQDGANLAIIDTTSEYNALQEIFARHKYLPSAQSDNILFLGFNDIIEEGEYLTIFGSPLAKTGYVKWNTGEPNSNTTLNCGALTRKGYMSIYGCNNVYAFFCEHPLV